MPWSWLMIPTRPGFFGPGGRGTAAYCGVEGRVDIITSTLGKALGGATGGFTSGRKEMIELLRQRSRPYLFSNTLPPAIVATGIKVLDIIGRASDLRTRLEENTAYFRDKISKLGFDIRPGSHPIVPIMLYDAKKASRMADRLLEEGLYVIAFSYPVVPREQARIRVQVSAAHSRADLDFALAKFEKVGRELGVIP
jgi:glycine C-acetyltransferase